MPNCSQLKREAPHLIANLTKTFRDNPKRVNASIAAALRVAKRIQIKGARGGKSEGFSSIANFMAGNPVVERADREEKR